MNEPPDVTFVIPCHRCGKTLPAVLGSIARQTYPAVRQVLVVTADPLDSDAVEASCPTASVVPLQSPRPAGAARNAGAARAESALLAFVDADVALPPDWLERLVERLQADRSIAAAGGAIANANPDRWPSRLLHWVEFSEFLPGASPGPRPFLSTSNLLVRRPAFEACGGFDLSLPMAEDLDLSRRLEGGLWLAGEVAVAHRHREQWPQVKDHLRELGYWSGRWRAGGGVGGAWLAQAPQLSILLPPYRLLRVLRRAWSCSAATGLAVTAHAPLLLAGLGYWSAGFYRGLRGGGG